LRPSKWNAEIIFIRVLLVGIDFVFGDLSVPRVVRVVRVLTEKNGWLRTRTVFVRRFTVLTKGEHMPKRNEKGNAVCHARTISRRKKNLAMSIKEFRRNGHGGTDQVRKMTAHLATLEKT
jgi:hypothetical protein